jgi:hypothetical protein
MQAPRRGARHDRRVPVPGRVRLLVQLVELPARPQTLAVLNDEARRLQVQRHGLGRVGLQFDRICASVGGGIDDGQGAVERLVVVARHLRYEIGPMVGTDGPFSDLHGAFPSGMQGWMAVFSKTSPLKW